MTQTLGRTTLRSVPAAEVGTFRPRENPERSDQETEAQRWRREAACLEEDPDVFFGGGVTVHRARTICRPCPVRTQCLAQALATDEQYGIWGGLTFEERQTVKRRLRARRLPVRSAVPRPTPPEGPGPAAA